MRGIGLSLSALVATSAFSPSASADSNKPVPWAGTSSTAEAPAQTQTVQNRRFTKEGRLVTRLGFQYLSRGDLRTNPGLTAEFSWYLREAWALEVLSATVYFSQLSGSADRLRRDFGLLPDSQRPLVRLSSGGRFAFAYGKFLIEPLDTVVHLDLSVALRLGAMITAQAVNFSFDSQLSLQVSLFDVLLLWVEGGWIQSYERREQSSFAGGPQGTLGVGFLW